jgi:hypothetical protein
VCEWRTVASGALEAFHPSPGLSVLVAFSCVPTFFAAVFGSLPCLSLERRAVSFRNAPRQFPVTKE